MHSLALVSSDNLIFRLNTIMCGVFTDTHNVVRLQTHKQSCISAGGALFKTKDHRFFFTFLLCSSDK